MTARRFREMEPIRPQPCNDLPLFQSGEAARDRVFQRFEDRKPDIVAALRHEALRVYRTTGQPVSANEIRHVLERFPGTDARILVTAFTGWQVVGHTRHAAKGNHARRILTYRPKDTE